MLLQGKRILFIGIGFYDYEEKICSKLNQEGADVTYVTSTTVNIFIRFLLKIGILSFALKLKNRIRKKKMMKVVGCDYVFIIKGHELTQDDINLLHSLNPGAKFILYLWDSLIRHDNRELLLRNFENIWSFDRKDCVSYPQLKFRPLFFREYLPVTEKKYKLSFIGWMHSDRLEIIRELRRQLKDSGESYYLKLYTGRFNYLLLRYLYRKLTPEDRELIILRPVGYSEVQKITATSQIVLDISHPQQSGLTMRTIETLAAGCHLLTTNGDIVNYPEIEKSSYTLLNRKKLQIPVLMVQDKERNEGFLTYFSLDRFINQLFTS